MFFIVVGALPGFTQSGRVLTLNEISDLIKNGVSPNRIAQLVEQHGVGFELDDRAMRRLKQDGANDTVLSAVKKMSARYVEERQQIKRQQEEEAKRKREEEAKLREEEKRGATEEKRRQAALERKRQEAKQQAEEAQRRQQEEAKQREDEQKRQQTEGEKARKEEARRAEELKRKVQ